jgi:hypothetical protein
MYLLPRDGSKLSIAWTEDPSEHTGWGQISLFNSANSNRGELLSRCKEERLVGACSNLVCQSMRHSDCLSGVSAVAISKFENDRCSRRRNATPAPAARVIQLRPRWRTPTAPRPCISLQPSPTDQGLEHAASPIQPTRTVLHKGVAAD